MSNRPPAQAKSRLSSLIQHHPLACFFALAYAITWLLWLPLVVSGDDSPTGLGFVLQLLGVFLVDPFEDQLTRPFLIYLALMILAASVVVAGTGPATLSRTHAKEVTVP